MLAHKNFWFLILTTIVVVCVVGFHHLYLNSIKIGATKIQKCNVRTFAYLICHTLYRTNKKPRYTFIGIIIGNNKNFIENLVCIQDRNGQKTRYPAEK